MAYAIVQTGGKQFRVTKGEVIRVPQLAAEKGAKIELDVLARGDGDRVEIGTPVLQGASVTATVLGHGRGPKIIVFKKKRRKQYKKKQGHRQDFTEVRIEAIGVESAEPETRPVAVEKTAAPVETAAPEEAAAVEAETAETAAEENE